MMISEARPDSEQVTLDNTMPKDILFQAAGPVLFVPHVFRGSKAHRYLLGWKPARRPRDEGCQAVPFKG
jgi:hypothetical protein